MTTSDNCGSMGINIDPNRASPGRAEPRKVYAVGATTKRGKLREWRAVMGGAFGEHTHREAIGQ